jgi:hypothetical protein
MTTRRESDLEWICLSALERPAAERAAFLIEACGSDKELRREAESLIARDVGRQRCTIRFNQIIWLGEDIVRD